MNKLIVMSLFPPTEFWEEGKNGITDVRLEINLKDYILIVTSTAGHHEVGSYTCYYNINIKK